MSVGARLREVRKALGLSQVEIASRCGISESAQRSFEKGRNLPGSAYLLKLVELDVDITYVLTGRVVPMDGEETDLVAAYRRATPELRAAALRTLGVAATSATSGPIIAGGEQGQVVMGNQTNEGEMTFNVGGKKRGSKK